MARRRFFVDEVHAQQAVLTGEEAQHLRQVLRAEHGQRYELSDGNKVLLGEIVHLRKDTVIFRVVEEIPQEPDLLDLTLGTALIKFDRFELLVEKATELGVSRIVPFPAIRSERGLEKAVEKRRDRWQRIALEAAKQCHRVAPPDVGPLQRFEGLLKPDEGFCFLLDESGGQVLLDGLPVVGERKPGQRVTLLVGPEGGWDPRERESAQAAGFLSVSLGRRILRTETAAAAAVSAIQLAWEQAAASPVETIAL
ncbi:MAG: 16S rRNA (uracil(1498)-N(3))-methyltransferase [Bryobacterales bacterium]|jgi:16S rRNA (uracil1498-N3)-methyltransferase|nr:16S rRNA (uracil(1498)-N(3))-methyltransferase [Bryobacterales bacterium]